MVLYLTLYYAQADITGNVTSLTWRQSKGCIYQELEVTFDGWFLPSISDRFNLFGSTDPADPMQELLLRGGIVPPDVETAAELRRGGAVPNTVKIVDWAWISQRLGPNRTLVIGPTRSAAERAVRKDRVMGTKVLDVRGVPQPLAPATPVGRWTYLRAATMHTAVVALAALAGLRAELWLPDYDIAAQVLDPQRSYWELIGDLVNPYAPDVFFRRQTNTVLIGDTVGRPLLVGTAFAFSLAAIAGLTVEPSTIQHVKRVILQVPPVAAA